jgi:hypothetical protein
MMVKNELRQVTVGSKNGCLKAISGDFHKIWRYLQVAYAIISYLKMTILRDVTQQNEQTHKLIL